MSIARTNTRTLKIFDSSFPIIIFSSDNKTLELQQYLKQHLQTDILLTTNIENLSSSIQQDYKFLIISFDYYKQNEKTIIDLKKQYKFTILILTDSLDDEAFNVLSNSLALDYFSLFNKNYFNDICKTIKRINRNSNVNVLLVEDDKSQRVVFSQRMKELNLNVTEVENGLEALKVLQDNKHFSLVVTDYIMPIMDGMELTQKIRKQYNKDELVILGLSATEDIRLVAKFIKNGANDCLRKNISSEEFFCKIHQHLEMLDFSVFYKNAATKDFLTQLYNRRFLFTEGKRLYLENYTKHKLSVAILDIDFFKKVNDTYGHASGDIVLNKVSSFLKEKTQNNILARIGGEEFAIIFKCDHNEAAKILENIRIDISKMPIEIEDKKEIKVTISAGVVAGILESFDETINQADLLLYKAKEAGRNRICFAK